MKPQTLVPLSLIRHHRSIFLSSLTAFGRMELILLPLSLDHCCFFEGGQEAETDCRNSGFLVATSRLLRRGDLQLGERRAWSARNGWKRKEVWRLSENFARQLL
ncbi:hypothetical protein SLE2022_132740 [Rubroshorea leprosula]